MKDRINLRAGDYHRHGFEHRQPTDSAWMRELVAETYAEIAERKRAGIPW